MPISTEKDFDRKLILLKDWFVSQNNFDEQSISIPLSMLSSLELNILEIFLLIFLSKVIVFIFSEIFFNFRVSTVIKSMSFL